ncbi:hypothetical protein A8C56_19320 [Niabella ginsenosidivorans]|uniref:DUF218 domain-containing protein n=2 Tax=Niabella ginsenosidivorans TaxID=1176587 RepID=A0A1A9I597_9BACT|nr:hypothetical protein A8C56_19320 [Niabella ginsenosidivorans]
MSYCQKGSYQEETKILQKRIFYCLDAIEECPSVYKAFYSDTVLQRFMKQKCTLLQKAIDACAHLSCVANAILIKPEEDSVVALQFSNLYQKNSQIRQWVRDRIRATGFYRLGDSLSDASLFIRAWEEASGGINYIINAYLKNEGLQYPKVDSAAFYVKNSSYLDSVRHLITSTLASEKEDSLFFQPLLHICLKILLLNGRDEAARLLPLKKVNERPYQQIRSVQWKRFPFSTILVFGEGPETDEPISMHNKERCAAAAALFRAGKAPFIMVSGGYVHPFQTKYCEAVQMKKYLTDSLAIPDVAIIIEPHARHTTTNIRNANRIIYECKIPADKPVLGVSSASHIQYIAGKSFERVCRRDLKYLPFKRMKHLTDETVAFYPSPLSLQINTGDPLDP